MKATCLPSTLSTTLSPHIVDQKDFESLKGNGIDKVDDKVGRQSGGDLRREVWARGTGWIRTELPFLIYREGFEA